MGTMQMEVLIINQMEVRDLLPMAECMDAMEAALETLARGEVILPLRPILWLPERVGALGMMPAYMGEDWQTMGLKVISVMPGNLGTEYDSHQGAVLLFEAKHGRLLAIIDASEVTAIRTAAASGVATRLLARPDADDLAILGSGVQARTHLEAMMVARDLKRVRVWSRNRAHARDFSEWAERRHGVSVEVVGDARTAVSDADIICTTTAAPEPILMGEWLEAGVHINAVGSSVKSTRELDTAAVVQSRLYVDRRESTVNEAGDFLLPKEEGAIGDDHIQGEIGELLLGEAEGRRSDSEITLFKSLGLAIEDLAAAHHVYNKAMKEGVGTAVELGGSRNV
jgi:ornithine cyclodeaminase